MNPISPLQLRDYILTLLHMESNADYVNPESGESQSVMGLDFDFKTQKDHPIFRVDMDVWVNEKEEDFKKAPYRIHIMLSTILEFEDSVFKDDVRKLLGPNGLAMTYSIARGIVGQATGTSLYGKHVLPTVNFIDLLKSKAKEMQKSKPQGKRRPSQLSK